MAQLPPAAARRDVEASEEDSSQSGSSPPNTGKMHPLSISKQTTRASRADLTVLLDQVMASPADNADLLRRIEERMRRVGLTFPGVEVRWDNLTAEAVLPRGSERTTTLWTTTLDMFKALAGIFVPEKHTHKHHVMLDNVSGVLKPGRMTLLLGPPGAGKTTLLRTLAGQMGDNKAVQFTGQVTYNGKAPGQDFVVERAAAYVEQLDQHEANMTVAETLYFASEMLGPGLSKALHSVITEREKELGIKPDADLEAMWTATFQDKRMSIWVNLFSRLLGLEHVMDTVVGDQQLKGISGGQRRRVTSAELAVGLAQCMFLDEISTGLDSAVTFQICEGLRNLCKHMNGTYIVSLLQPAPETFDLFDDVMVMAGRRIVYHGPREEVLPFFESLGFFCPPTKTTPDFLQEVVTSTDQHRYWDETRGPHQYVGSKRVAQHFEQSQRGRELRATLQSAPYTHELEGYVLHQHEYALGWWQQFGAVLRREVLLAYGKSLSLTFLAFNLFQMAFVAFITATTFPQLPKDSFNDGNLFLSVIFFALMNMFMGGFNFAPQYTKRLPVFYKQRGAKFHDVWTWVIANSLIRLPEAALTASLYGIIVYFSVSFTATAGRFFTFWLLLFGMNCLGVALFMLMGALTGSDIMAQGLGAVVGLMMISLSGFPIAFTNIGWWLRWLAWGNPMSWALRAIAINEMTSPEWNASAAPFGPADQPVGTFVLESRGILTDWKFVWAGVGVELGFSLLLVVLQGLALTWVGPHVVNNPPAQDEDAAEGSNKGAVPVNVAPASVTRLHQQQALPAVETAHAPTADKAAAAPSAARAGKGSALPFEPMTLAFHGVSYWVPKPGGGHGEELQLLHETYGAFKPGVLTALMGASGAGKTTLMDVLAGRKTAGRAAGVQTVNGHPKEMATFARVMGYVEQLDVHVEQATVHEALLFSARLRLDPHLGQETINAFVDEVMELVELDPLAHRVVGDLTTEQRKRLTIAVELVANPSVLFADEPTSGLDSRAALVVMKALRNIVNTGRTVVCTIHQPSTEIFTAFDELLLLKPGGRVIYNGPLGANGANLIDYMTSFPNVERPEPTANPSVFMLEVSAPAVEKAQGIDWANRWAESELSQRALQEAQDLCQPKAGTQPVTFKHKRAVSTWTQWKLLFERNMTTHWRNPAYNVLRFAITIILGVFMGLLYLNRGGKTDTMLGITDILGALYSTTVFLGICNLLIVMPGTARERPAMYRERASELYGGLAYSTAQGAAEFVYLIIQGLLYTVIVYFMVGFADSATKFWWFYLYMQLGLCIFTFFGMACLHLAPSVVLATNGGSFFVLLWNVFCGFLIAQPDIYGWWIWAYYFNPATWVLYGTIVTQLGNVDSIITLGPGIEMPVSQYIEDTYSYQYEWRGWVVLILFGFLIATRMVATLGVTKLNFQTR